MNPYEYLTWIGYLSLYLCHIIQTLHLMSRRSANVHFSGENETRDLAAQLSQVHKGSTWMVAPDVIWHICSRRHWFKGRRYPLSVFVAHLPNTWDRSPVSFKKIGQCSIFRGNWDKGPSSAAPQGSQGWCTASSSWHDLAHLLLAVLLPGGLVAQLPQGRGLVHGRWLLIWFGTFTLPAAAPRGMEALTCHLQGMLPTPWGRSAVSFKWIGQCSFFRGNWDKS